MRKIPFLAMVLLACEIGPALAAYPAPVGNCDAAVMLLEAARVAQSHTAAAIAKNKGCGIQAVKALDANVGSAALLAKRADGLLAACPGMDDAMWQGARMASFAKDAAADANKARAACTAP